MALATVRGVEINFDIVGDEGPWVAYCGGGRSDLEAARPVANLIAAAGYRVVIFDRRNCGGSEFSIAGVDDEQVAWAEDTHELLSQMGALPVLAGGASAGCRLALMMAVRHPSSIAGLFLARPSGGAFAAQYLAASNYDQLIAAAQCGGMEAVAEVPTIAELIRRNPGNRSRVLAQDPIEFVETLDKWRRVFTENADLTLMGVTDEELSSIEVPVCIIAGQDDLHPRNRSERLHDLLPQSEIHYLYSEEDVDRVREAGYTGPYATIQETPEELTEVFIDFFSRVPRSSQQQRR